MQFFLSLYLLLRERERVKKRGIKKSIKFFSYFFTFIKCNNQFNYILDFILIII